jgi:hypothetical protein
MIKHVSPPAFPVSVASRRVGRSGVWRAWTGLALMSPGGAGTG